MDGPRHYNIKWNNPGRERQMSYNIAYMFNPKENDANELIYKIEIDPLIEKTNMVIKGEM